MDKTAAPDTEAAETNTATRYSEKVTNKSQTHENTKLYLKYPMLRYLTSFDISSFLGYVVCSIPLTADLLLQIDGMPAGLEKLSVVGLLGYLVIYLFRANQMLTKENQELLKKTTELDTQLKNTLINAATKQQHESNITR